MTSHCPAGTYDANYGQDSSIARTQLQRVFLIAGIILIFAAPWYLGSDLLTQLNEIGIYIIVASGVFIAISCGIVNLGQAGFMCIGAFTSGILCSTAGFSLWGALPIAIIASGLMGVLCGLTLSRIKGFIAAVVTIAVGIIIPEMFMIILPMLDLPAEAVSLPEGISIGGKVLGSQGLYLLIWVLVLLTALLVLNLSRSKTGRAFRGTRDNELVSEAVGLNIRRHKIVALLVCSILAGIGGWLWACHYSSISAGAFRFTLSLECLGIVVLGGMGSVGGIFIGSVIVLGIKFALSNYLLPWLEDMFMTGPWYGVLPLGDLIGRLGGITPLLLGIIFILVFTFSPSGMVGWWNKFKTYYRLWPLPR